ncbi:MAG: CRISPR-associated protein Cas5 [Candidatus Lokiarchaeota archaeon]|nr:CRISPR-associated protein Cas5 [Candidatus Lokiarchaeota archaeon]
MFKINSILIFDLEGKFGHFKKYYSNVSSLTYQIPPRTVLTGLIASIMGRYPRDTYYEIFSPQNCKLSVRVISPVRKHIECLNYKKNNGVSTQVRLEILLPMKEKIVYRIYFTHFDDKIIAALKQKLLDSDLGYGIYFGQRQFRANAIFHDEIDCRDLKIVKDPSAPIVSLTNKKNVKQFSDRKSMEIIETSMPCQMKKIINGRIQESMVNICYERNGLPLFGNFKEAIEIRNDVNISFFTQMYK